MDEVAICVDAGTTVIKAVVFDGSGRELLVARRDTAVRHPARERAEQDMDEVWGAVVTTVREAVRRVPGPVRLLAVTGQGDGLWPVDAADRPTRPAVLWNDARAADLVERWAADGVLEQAFRTNASLTNAGLPNAVLRVLEDEEPAVVARTTALLTCGSWLFLRLTGVRGLDPSDASAPWLDIASGAYSDELLDLYGLARHRALLPPVLANADRVQGLRATAAVELGLPTGTPVVLAPYDVVSTAVGTGATAAGQAVSVLGTTLCTETLVATADPSGEPSGLTLHLGRPDLFVRAFPTLAGCGVIDWTARLLGLPDAAALSDLAATAPAGADGLVVLPYLSPAGERAPFLDPAASGLLGGVTFAHGPEHVARAVLEGLAHVVRDCLEAAARPPEELMLCGGGASSALWCQVIADVTGVPTARTADTQVGAKGALLVATVALGEYVDLAAAASALVRADRRFDPDPGSAAGHDDGRRRFLATRAAVAPTWSRVRTSPVASHA